MTIAKVFITSLHSSGTYHFPGQRNLNGNEQYAPEYTGIDVRAVCRAHAPEMNQYSAGETASFLDMDITGIDLHNPQDSISGYPGFYLPAAFYWSARPSSPDEAYTFVLYDLHRSYKQQVPHVNHDTLNSLPEGWAYDQWYNWSVEFHNPNGTWGEACGTNIKILQRP